VSSVECAVPCSLGCARLALNDAFGRWRHPGIGARGFMALTVMDVAGEPSLRGIRSGVESLGIGGIAVGAVGCIGRAA
jgi:hypothetical protein